MLQVLKENMIILLDYFVYQTMHKLVGNNNNNNNNNNNFNVLR